MKCPHCGSSETRVYDTKMRNGINWRWRFCKSCNQSFTSQEKYVLFSGSKQGMIEKPHPYAAGDE